MSNTTENRPTPALLASLIPAPRQVEPVAPHVQQQIDKAFKLKEKSNSRDRNVVDREVNTCWRQHEPVDAVKKIMLYFRDTVVLAPSAPPAPAHQPSAAASKTHAERLDHICQRKVRALRKRKLISLSA